MKIKFYSKGTGEMGPKGKLVHEINVNYTPEQLQMEEEDYADDTELLMVIEYDDGTTREVNP